MKRRATYLIAALVTVLSLIGGGAVAATQLAAEVRVVPTPIGVQPDGRIAGCVKSSAGTGPAVLSVRRTTGTCGTGFKTVYWNQKGAIGAKGATGAVGPKGATGEAAPTPTYGIGLVSIKRGTGAYDDGWSPLSTALGSPIGDTVSSAFRMTCPPTKAPCWVKVRAYSTGTGVKVYPRLVIQKSDIDTGKPIGQCEYGDGTDNSGGTQAMTATVADVPLGVGGSLDCGSDQELPASGVVDEIKVPAGYYDLYPTFRFIKQ